MLLFAISFLLIFASSYFLTSILSPKKSILGFLYLFILAFAQIVLTLEVLSLFSAIRCRWVLILNVMFFFTSMFIWNYNLRPHWSLDCADFKRKIVNAFKLDMSLFWLYVGFGVFIFSALFLCAISPITNADAGAYHVLRSLIWVLQHNLNHSEIPDIRDLCLPINSEILYAWVLLFVRKVAFLGFFSFVGYLLAVVSVYNIMGYLHYSTRKRLWVIFILSSFPSVLVQASGTETDIIIAGLVTSAIFMFWYAVKNNKITPLYMSALAYALAIGTKTTSLIAIPSVALLMITICYVNKKYKPILGFIAFCALNFLIFSSYNYILNYIDFGNFFSSQSFMQVSKNYYGIKAIPANFIKYIFMFFDFTGFRWSDYIGPSIINLRNSILAFCHLKGIPDGLYTSGYDIQRTLIEPMMGAGILGFLVYLPCLFVGFIKPIFKFKSKRVWIISGFAFLFFVNLITTSYLLAYMSFSIRFVMFFMVLSAPILVQSYFKNRNPFKYIIIFFALFYLIAVSTHLWVRPANKMGHLLLTGHSIAEIRLRSACKDFDEISSYRHSECLLKYKIKSDFKPQNRILAFFSHGEEIFFVKELELEGYKIDFGLMEDANNIDFSKYNIIISTHKGQTVSLIKHFEERKHECFIKKGRVYVKPGVTVPCLYIPNMKLPHAKLNGSSYPFQVRCVLSENFIIKKHLELVATSGIVKPLLMFKDQVNYYTIYRNKDLPLMLKKGVSLEKNKI